MQWKGICFVKQCSVFSNSIPNQVLLLLNPSVVCICWKCGMSLKNQVWSNLYFYWQRYASSQWSKCCGLMRRSWVSPYWLWKYAPLWHTLLLLRPITKPHFNLFFTTISRSKRIFFPEGELKKEFQLTHVCKQCCGALIDNARLVAFLVLEFSL